MSASAMARPMVSAAVNPDASANPAVARTPTGPGWMIANRPDMTAPAMTVAATPTTTARAHVFGRASNGSV